MHIRFTRVDGPASPPRYYRRQAVKEELALAIRKERDRILHYLRGGGVDGPSGSRVVVSEAERAARQ